MGISYSHGREFIRQIKPVLTTGDQNALIGFLQSWWPHDRLCELLDHGHDEACKVAVFCLALTGTMEDTPAIALLLHNEDIHTANLAEDALWCIWFRDGDDNAIAQLLRAIQQISEDRLKEAANLLTDLVNRCATFAEAYNQRAIASFLLNDYAQAAEDYLTTIRFNPYHFGAMAGLGHCYASKGQLVRALEAYRCALQLHPRTEGLRQAIQKIREALRLRNASRILERSLTT